MSGVSRLGDTNAPGGKILRGASTVFVNNIAVGLNVSQISSHAPFGSPHPPHNAATTTEGSPTVFAEGSPILRIGSGVTCGHPIVQGSSDVFCP